MNARAARGRRVLLWTLGTLWTLMAASLAQLAAPSVALAYVDPSVMTYTIQALAGVAVAIGAVAGVMWRRVRRKVLELLNVDEDHGKTREGNVHRTDCAADAGAAGAGAADEAGAAGATPAAQPSPKRKRSHSRAGAGAGATPAPIRELSYPKRFGFMIVALAFVMYTYLVAGPYEIIGSNAEAFAFTLRDVWLVMLVFALLTGTAIAALLSLLRGRAYCIALGTAFALAFAGFLQALFMNDGLPSADGHAVPWGNFAGTMAFNIVIWAAIIALCIFLVVRFPALSRACIVVLAIACMAAQSIGIAGYLVHDIVGSYTEPTVTKEGLFEVASENNVIVLVVDTADTQDFKAMLQDYPDVMDEFTGFTFFEDSAGSFIPTSMAVPFLVTGQLLEAGQPYEEYDSGRFEKATFIDDISAQNYSIGLYADCLFTAKTKYADKTLNLKYTSSMPVDIPGTLRILTQVTLYRNAPWVLKPLFWYYTDDINQAVMGSGETPDEVTPYIIDDVRYYRELQERGLTVSDEEGKTGAFRMIHLNGAHVPYVYDENMNYVEGGTTQERQLRGSFSILQEYIRELKELGVYDDATIIITADHGRWTTTTDALSAAASPLCLVKPSTAAGGSSAPYATSSIPVSQEDFHPTVIDACGGDKSAYGTGLTYFDLTATERLRTYVHMTTGDDDPTILWQYEIDGNALDFANWRYTGISWDAY